jgi:hypothetical protein
MRRLTWADFDKLRLINRLGIYDHVVGARVDAYSLQHRV